MGELRKIYTFFQRPLKENLSSDYTEFSYLTLNGIEKQNVQLFFQKLKIIIY